MNRQLLSALGIAALLSAGAAFAQSNTPSTGATSGSQTPAAGTTPSGMTAAPDAGKAAMPSKTDSASSAFTRLSAKHPGYVSSDDVSKLQGFDFKSADKNNDGKLDETEFNAAWKTYSSAGK